jgi:hypothetical protein
MRTLSLGLAAAIAAGAVLVAIPGRAQAQVGISVGFGSGSFYDPAYDDEFGWSPRYQPQNVYGYNSPVAYGYGTRVGYGYGSPYTAQPVVTTRRVVVRDTYRPRRVVVREVYEPRRVVVRRDPHLWARAGRARAPLLSGLPTMQSIRPRPPGCGRFHDHDSANALC